MQITVVSYDELMVYAREDTYSHYQEAPWDDLKLELDDALYRAAGVDGTMRFYLATFDGSLAGYMSVIAANMLQHKDKLMAITESFYVVPECRSRNVFGRLLKYVEQDCADLGIDYFTVAFPKTEKGALERLMKIAGYRESEVSYSKGL